MQIYVNDVVHEVQEGLYISDLIGLLGLEGKRIAVEVNQQLVPRSQFQAQRLAKHDRIELIHAVGGG